MTKNNILKLVGELGFLEIYKNGKILITPPIKNIHLARMEPFVRFLVDYKRLRPDFRFRGFFTLYDAWREHAEPSRNPQFKQCRLSVLEEYVGTGTLGEGGRFIQPYHLKDLFPIFNHPVCSFGRHKNDCYTVLVPDSDFISTCGYGALRTEIDEADRGWDHKIPRLYWRGAPHGFAYQAYDSKKKQSQRDLLVNWSLDSPLACDAQFSHSVTKKEQLGYKYLIDIDGEVNAWSGLFWKLYSKSVVFKVESHYEQWYYRDLIPWKHFIPVKGDLSDLHKQYQWALQNDDRCHWIADNGNKFASNLTYDRVLNTCIFDD